MGLGSDAGSATAVARTRAGDHLGPFVRGGSRAGGAALADRALVLVANRLCVPASEHGLARWLDNDFVCDRHGRRWLVQWRDEQERQTSRTPLVQVAFGQLQQWYRTLDELYAGKAEIERELFLRLRNLLSLKAEVVFYDVTSTYFEGHGPPVLVDCSVSSRTN